MLVETNYQNLQDEVDDMRKLIKNFRVRYKQAVTEINDLNEEHALERAELFDQIQVYDKELSLYKTLLRCVIEPRDIVKLEQVSKYDEVNKKWVVPLFTIGQRRVDFPA